MAAQIKRVVWDACSWIALILEERIYDKQGNLTEDRGQACRVVIDEAERGNIEIVAPAMTLVEVCSREQVKKKKNAKIRAFFDHEYIYSVGLDTEIADLARDLVLQRLPRGLPWLRPVDATYVATAADLNVTELHTFDGALLKLSGRYKTKDGSLITVRKPGLAPATAPLFEDAER